MKTVITYGTFDLFHVGHVRLLRRLRELGDRLVVGCSSDEFNALKGKKSIMPYDQRAEILLACKYVDHVFPENNWEQKRDNMKDVCSNCHQTRFVNGHYFQYDALVNLYDEKFAKPAGEIMKMIKEAGVMENPAAFSNQVEWEYWELWHHEGRRARMGAAMMGPDYAWWHGI
jgi:glycerol-3-phosphate cytidylyltransferase